MIINGVVVPTLRTGTDSEMAKEAVKYLLTDTQGWSAANKAAYWEALASQIEAQYTPDWVSVHLRGQNGEHVFSGRCPDVHRLVIKADGEILFVPKDCTITPSFTHPGSATVNYKRP